MKNNNISRNLWIISELFYPEDTSAGHYITKLAESLSKDYKINVICSQPTYSKRGLKNPVKEIYHHIRIYRCVSTTLNKNNYYLKIINMITFLRDILSPFLYVAYTKEKI